MKIELTTRTLMALIGLIWLLAGSGGGGNTEAVVAALVAYLAR